MGRRCIGVELKDDLAESVSEKFTSKQLVTDVNIICADSASDIAKEKVKARLDIMGRKHAQFLMLHPPYDDIIKFSSYDLFLIYNYRGSHSSPIQFLPLLYHNIATFQILNSYDFVI